MDHQSGIYETIYGNAARYEEGNDFAYDLDMAEEIPLEVVDFYRFIREED